MRSVEDVVFAVRFAGSPTGDPHWYANFGYYAFDAERKAYPEGAKLCRLNLRTGKLTVLLEDPRGGVRDPQVHYDGGKILFSYRKGGTPNYHLYEINADGTGLWQLTSGPWDDIEPTYTASGEIVFVSTRARRWVNCWLTQVAILFRASADGSGIRMISSNGEQDNTPWPMADGRILYTRWEYTDRSQVHYHHLWTSNPDGTQQAILYGNQRPGIVMIDAKPIPNSDKVVAVFSPGHGRKEHGGPIAIVDPDAGPDAEAGARQINPTRENYRDPWAFSEDLILAARGPSLVLMNGKGTVEEIFRLPEADLAAKLECHEPRPLTVRARERAIAPKVDLTMRTGTLLLSDIYRGRNMAGVRRGEIKKLLVLEPLPMPIHFSGGAEPVSYLGTFTLERIVGTVPVEEDGSAYFQLPALRSFFFVALDENEMSVKRMQSFLTVQPGETLGCTGCHEDRAEAPPHSGRPPLAVRRPPSVVEAIAGVPGVLDFPRDIQPVLDRHCVRCHDYTNRSGGVILSGDRGPMYSHSYFTLTILHQVADGNNRPRSNYPPRALGSSASPLMRKVSGQHHGVVLSAAELRLIRMWIESGAAYPGTYAALGTGMIGYAVENNAVRQDMEWASAKPAADAIGRRCLSCHGASRPLTQSISGDIKISRPEPPSVYGYPRPEGEAAQMMKKFSRHMVWNLTRPEKSMMLLAPLAREAGGYGLCGARVFADSADPDYALILAAVREAKQRLEEMKRFDMPGFVPRFDWVREMKRFGLLPETHAPRDPVDYYAVERRYWESLWYRPQ
ncbi:MAG: hypothetical protein HY822_11405 [Acidobacteria bacterium]|nr:hypothetical protein [Acidobacteriota bacterium]